MKYKVGDKVKVKKEHLVDIDRPMIGIISDAFDTDLGNYYHMDSNGGCWKEDEIEKEKE